MVELELSSAGRAAAQGNCSGNRHGAQAVITTALKNCCSKGKIAAL